MHRLRAACLIALLAAALVLTVAACSKGAFVGSTLSTTYHDPTCVWAEQIDRDRQIWFEDAAAAEAAGYVPCEACCGENAPAE